MPYLDKAERLPLCLVVNYNTPGNVMTLTPALFPALISAIAETITEQADAVTELDQAIGDGDHVFNLRGESSIGAPSLLPAASFSFALAFSRSGC